MTTTKSDFPIQFRQRRGVEDILPSGHVSSHPSPTFDFFKLQIINATPSSVNLTAVIRVANATAKCRDFFFWIDPFPQSVTERRPPQ
jgi:hypothetical protein